MTEQAETAHVAVVPESSNTKNFGIEELNSDVSLSAKLPQKRYFRQRAHANPFSDHLLE